MAFMQVINRSNRPKPCSMPVLLPHIHALQVSLSSCAMCKHLGTLVETPDMSYCREVRILARYNSCLGKLCLCSQLGAEHIAQIWLWRGWQLLSELCGLHNVPLQVAPAPQIRPTISLSPVNFVGFTTCHSRLHLRRKYGLQSACCLPERIDDCLVHMVSLALCLWNAMRRRW